MDQRTDFIDFADEELFPSDEQVKAHRQSFSVKVKALTVSDLELPEVLPHTLVNQQHSFDRLVELTLKLDNRILFFTKVNPGYFTFTDENSLDYSLKLSSDNRQLILERIGYNLL